MKQEYRITIRAFSDSPFPPSIQDIVDNLNIIDFLANVPGDLVSTAEIIHVDKNDYLNPYEGED